MKERFYIYAAISLCAYGAIFLRRVIRKEKLETPHELPIIFGLMAISFLAYGYEGIVKWMLTVTKVVDAVLIALVTVCSVFALLKEYRIVRRK